MLSDIRSIEAAVKTFEHRANRNTELQKFIQQHVRLGMTMEEVVTIVGAPAERKKPHTGSPVEEWVYGDSQRRAEIVFDRRGFVYRIELPEIGKVISR